MRNFFILLCLLLTTGFVHAEGKIYYHLTFPVQIDEQTEAIHLTKNYDDLIMTNLIAGALYAHLLHHQFPDLTFNEEYLVGSIFAQLLQENLQTNNYRAESVWINPDPAIREMLLASGQGGPYQLNDYSKRLENKIGLINFASLQKSLGYSVEDQDSGAQTKRKGPPSLDNKYFGPLAAAYFQFNNMMRLQAINSETWGPSYQYFNVCLSNLSKADTSNNFLDMILNATYNAGPYADITKTYIEICANANNSLYADKVNNINNYSFDDKKYQQVIGTREAIGSTFILYPRQIRYYIDELFNQTKGLNLNNSVNINLNQLKTIFVLTMSTLASIDKNGKYDFIDKLTIETAFDSARKKLNLLNQESLHLEHAKERKKLLALLQASIEELAVKLNIDFTAVTENNLAK